VLRVTLRNLLAHKVRLLLSTLAIVLGIAFLSGVLTFNTGMQTTFDGIIKGSTSDGLVRPEGAESFSDAGAGTTTSTLQPAVVDREEVQVLVAVEQVREARGAEQHADGVERALAIDGAQPLVQDHVPLAQPVPRPDQLLRDLLHRRRERGRLVVQLLERAGRGLRLPLDVYIVASANPEDYTNRGSIITPLKDRIDSQILTHYPQSIDISKEITMQEAALSEFQRKHIHIHELATHLIERIAFEARESEYIDQKSGVSARLTISAYENLHSKAERRMIINNENGVSRRFNYSALSCHVWLSLFRQSSVSSPEDRAGEVKAEGHWPTMLRVSS
jgi:hypothetical protein